MAIKPSAMMPSSFEIKTRFRCSMMAKQTRSPSELRFLLRRSLPASAMEAPPEGKTTRVLVVGDVDDAAQLQAKQTRSVLSIEIVFPCLYNRHSVMKQQSFDLVLCAGRFKGGVKVLYSSFDLFIP